MPSGPARPARSAAPSGSPEEVDDGKRLVRVGREEPPSRKTLNKREINRRSLGLKTATIGGGLTYGTADLPSVFVEHQDIRGEGVI